MSSLPGVKISIKDGALGRLSQGSTNAFGLIGTTTVQISDPKDKKKNITTPGLNKVTMITDRSKISEVLGDGSLKDALNRAFDLGATKVYAYGVKDSTGHVTAVEKLLEDTNLKEFIAVADPTDSSFWSAFATKLENAANKHNYTFGVVQTRAPKKDENSGAYVTALQKTERGIVQSKRLQICVGDHLYIDAHAQTQTAPFLYSYIGILQGRLPHEGPDAFKYGALPGVVGLVPEFTDGETETLQNAGYTVPRRYYGVPGVYVNLAKLATDNTSDFDTVEKIRIINKVSRQVRRQQLTFVNANVVLDGSAEGLLQFKQHSELPLKTMISAGEISGAEVVIPEGQDIIGTREVKVTIRVKPLGKLSTIQTTLSFTKDDLKK